MAAWTARWLLVLSILGGGACSGDDDDDDDQPTGITGVTVGEGLTGGGDKGKK